LHVLTYDLNGVIAVYAGDAEIDLLNLVRGVLGLGDAPGLPDTLKIEYAPTVVGAGPNLVNSLANVVPELVVVTGTDTYMTYNGRPIQDWGGGVTIDQKVYSN